MTLEEAAKRFGIPLEDLTALRRAGLLREPVPPEDIVILSFLSQTWGKSRWLKRQLARFNRKARHALVRTAEFSKTEAYIFNRYYNAEKGKRLLVSDVAEELNLYYWTPITHDLIRKIFKIRRKARDARYYDRKNKRDGYQRRSQEFENSISKRAKDKNYVSSSRSDIFG